MHKKMMIFVGVLLIAALIWFLIDFFTESDKEKLNKLMRELEAAAEDANWEKCMSLVSPNYYHDGLDYNQLKQTARVLLQKYGPMEIHTIKRKITVSGSIAVVDTRIIARPRGESQLPTNVYSEWQVSFEKRDDRWLVSKVSPVSVNGRPVRGLQDLLGF